MKITAPCPVCRVPHEFEQCSILPSIVPCCDSCEAIQKANWNLDQERRIWSQHLAANLPSSYHIADPSQVLPLYAPALSWQAPNHHGGVGIVGESGEGKSCAVACLVMKLQRSFLWWSGTEARDAATEAATADKDREGAMRRWQAAMRISVLVLDDISQGRMTEAWSSKLFDLLETRIGSGLPTFWTSQVSLPDLRKKIIRQNGGDDKQADAISRRLGQHSLVLG